MTTYSGVVVCNYLEYGYGVGFGMCYGAISSHLGWHMISDETPQQYTRTGEYPKGFYFRDRSYDQYGRVTSVTDAGDLSFSDQSVVSGTLSNGDILNPLSFATGAMGLSVQRYFLYDQIHIIPNIFSLGAVAVDRQVSARIWSAFFETKVASNITYYNASGFSEDLSDEIPYTFAMLEERDWYFDIDADSGSAVIMAKITIIIDGEPYDVEFTGVRAQSWVYPHNWKDPVMETLEWKTAINVTYDGTEARAALIDNARRSFEYSMYLKTDDAKRMENTAFRWQAKVFLIPVHTYFSQLTADAVVGVQTISLDTVDKGFVVGGYAILYNESTGLFESMTITSVTSTTLGILAPLTNNWSKYATVFVGAAGYIQGNLPITWQTNNFAEGKVRFQLMPAETDAFTPDVAATDLYRSEEVLTREPDWAGGITYDMTFESGVIDPGVGVVFNYDIWKRPSRVMQHSWLLKGLTDIRKFREFLYRRRGMASSFWMPSWRNDFNSVTRNYLSGTTQFEFYDNNFILMSAGKVERQHIQIELKNGTIHRAKISAYTEVSPGVISITLNTVFPVTFHSSDIRRASWLSRHRLASDSIQLEWVHARLVRATLPIATVPDYETQDAA